MIDTNVNLDAATKAGLNFNVALESIRYPEAIIMVLNCCQDEGDLEKYPIITEYIKKMEERILQIETIQKNKRDGLNKLSIIGVLLLPLILNGCIGHAWPILFGTMISTWTNAADAQEISQNKKVAIHKKMKTNLSNEKKERRDKLLMLLLLLILLGLFFVIMYYFKFIKLEKIKHGFKNLELMGWIKPLLLMREVFLFKEIGLKNFNFHQWVFYSWEWVAWNILPTAIVWEWVAWYWLLKIRIRHLAYYVAGSLKHAFDMILVTVFDIDVDYSTSVIHYTVST
jgi:hypothetical protein